MKKVTPSQKMRKEIEAVLEGTPGEFNGQGILEEIIRKGAGMPPSLLELAVRETKPLCWARTRSDRLLR